MANIYVKNTGSNTSPYDTWAKAATTLATAAGFASAGDTIWVSHQHAESQASTMTFSFTNGTPANPILCVCGNDGATPPTALATTATVTVTGGNNLNLNTGSAYIYGIQFSAGLSMIMGSGGIKKFESCLFYLTGTSGGINISGSTQPYNTYLNCTIRFSNAAHSISLAATNNCLARFVGGGFHASTTSPTSLFANSSSMIGEITMEDFDLSVLATSFNFVNNAAGQTGANILVRNCKLPTNWAGTMYTTALTNENLPIVVVNSDYNAINYWLWQESYAGSVKHETTLVRTGGANNGVNALSLKMVSSANTKVWGAILTSPEIVIWNDVVGVSRTATIDFLHDSVTNLKDNEIWIELSYLGSSGSPIGTFTQDFIADFLTTAADQAASSATWTSTGMSNPNKQKVNVTFTPQIRGFIIAKVKLAKASYTVYVDPKIQLS